MYKHFDESKSTSWSAYEWKDWIANKLEDMKNVYISNPKHRIAAYIRERDYKQDYQGRELLELIQNSDDAGVNYNTNKEANKLLIKVGEEALYVANTGIPFSAEGVESLMISNLSPKRHSAHFIGNKGLGFRSILGWSKTTMIKSGNLSVVFSEKNSKGWLRGVRKTYPEIDRGIKKEVEKDYIATLSTPVWVDATCAQDEMLVKVNSECDSLRKEGYDTVICLVFKKDKHIKKQLDKELKLVNTELLLFLKHIKDLRIVNGKVRKSWQVKRDVKKVITCDEKGRKNVWKIESETGKIPKKLIKETSPNWDMYEIKVAIPEVPIKPGKLSVYFPTKHDFPFPLYAHATFDVQQNRQYINVNDLNVFIAKRLAALMVKAAVKARSKKDPWRAMTLVSSMKGECLEDLKFLKYLYDQARKTKLVPVRGASFMCPKDVFSIDHDFDRVLKGGVFSDLALYVDNEYIDDLFSSLEVKEIGDEDLCKRINRISNNLTFEEKTDLIVQLLLMKGYMDFNSEVKPHLLVDDKGNVIRSKNIMYPDEKGKIELPDWVDQKMINKDQLQLLLEKQDKYDEQDLVQVLEKFNVKEINKESLIASIIDTAQKKIKRSTEKRGYWTKQMISALWDIYKSDEDELELSEDVKILLPTRTGEYIDAKELYMGIEYEKGKISEYLFKDINQGLFVSSPDLLGLKSGSNEVCEFLVWLGVAYYPRYYTEQTYENEIEVPEGYIDEVISNLKFPVTCGKGKKYTKKSDFGYYFRKNILEYSTFHLLEEIIKKSAPHAILAWVHNDSNVEDLFKEGDVDGKLEINVNQDRNFHMVDNQKLYPYPLWFLKTTPWIISQDTKKMRPDHCLIRKDDYLFPKIGVPLLDYEYQLFKDLKMDKRMVLNALRKVGVANYVGDLSWDAIYMVLCALPKNDKVGRSARSIYRKFIEKDNENPSGEWHDKFMETGKMFGKKGEEFGYFSIEELYYSDNPVKSAMFSNFIPVLELDSNKGAAKVEKIFGVKNLAGKKHKIKVLKVLETEFSKSIQNKFEEVKPYIYALFMDVDKEGSFLEIVKKTEIRICKEIDILVKTEDEQKKMKVTTKHVRDDKKKNVFYIMLDRLEGHDISGNALLSRRIEAVFAEMINHNACMHISKILVSGNNQRVEVLDDVSGGSGAEKVKRCKSLFGVKENNNELFLENPVFMDDTDEEHVENEDDQRKKEESDTQPVQDNDEDDVDNLIDEFIVEHIVDEKEEIINDAPKGMSAIVQEKSTGKRYNSICISDGKQSEQLIKEYEKKEKRYPEDVSAYRGLVSYGCDIISFSTEAERNAFRSKPNTDLIARFIEVKGRSDKQGGITLKGNQLECAKMFKERFYLYRVYKDSEGYEVLTLNDPLNSPAEEVLIQQYEVKIQNSSRKEIARLRRV